MAKDEREREIPAPTNLSTVILVTQLEIKYAPDDEYNGDSQWAIVFIQVKGETSGMQAWDANFKRRWSKVEWCNLEALSILQESWFPTHHTGIPAPFSRPLGTVARRAGVLNSSLATGQGLPRPVFVMRAHGGTCGVGHVWRTGGREMV